MLYLLLTCFTCCWHALGGNRNASLCIHQHTSAYVPCIRQHTSAYVWHALGGSRNTSLCFHWRGRSTANYVSIRQHTSAYVSIRQTRKLTANTVVKRPGRRRKASCFFHWQGSYSNSSRGGGGGVRWRHLLSALPVQKYLIYWDKSTNTETEDAGRSLLRAGPDDSANPLWVVKSVVKRQRLSSWPIPVARGAGRLCKSSADVCWRMLTYAASSARTLQEGAEILKDGMDDSFIIFIFWTCDIISCNMCEHEI
jgi:hypothetical protein